MKIIEKPHPIGNKFNTMYNAKLQIVLYAKFYKEKDIAKHRGYMDEVGATTACCFRITETWKGTGRVVIGHSLFGSVNSVAELMNKNGLYQ